MKDQYRTTQQAVQAWRGTSTIDDYISLPPPAEAEIDSEPRHIDAGLLIVVSANVGVMLIVIGGMLWGGKDPVYAVIGGVVYFTVTSPLYLAIVTGALTAIMGRREREKTERLRIRAYQELGEMAFSWRLAIEENQRTEIMQRALPHSPPTQPLPAPSPSSRFVAPYADGEDRAKQEALAWLAGLYGADGLPDPRKVAMTGDRVGWLKVRMLGSRRGGGSREAGLWLLQQGIVRKVDRNYRFNIMRFPNRNTLRDLR